jgi:protocatechuate 3,4-dioxygenase beta subunit
MSSFLRSTTLAFAFPIIFATLSPASLAQESRKEPGGSVSGRVTVGGHPVARAVVVLSNTQMGPIQRTPGIKGTTDEEGYYRITGVPAGSYTVSPFMPAFVIPAETSSAQPGKSVTLGEDEQVEDVDFSLTRGGVITGRVTDGDGRPVVEQFVTIIRLDERGQRMPAPFFSPFRFMTDDRGIYRIYGLAPGRYKVSAGDSPDSGIVRFGYGGGSYPRTFHPDVSDESRAVPIEVRAGGEATDVDIKMGRPTRSYIATGRVVDADSGKPLPNLAYGHGSLRPGQMTIGAYGWAGNRTSANGEFQIDGLAPGRYAAFVISSERTEFYSEPAVFDVTDSDVTGLEIKVRRGSIISGQAIIEGTTDPDALSQISKLELRAVVLSDQVTPPAMSSIRINPDGSFLITGLPPGKVRLLMSGVQPPKGFSLLRVERDGVDQRAGIEVGAGETVTGVRVVFGYGTGVVRGEVRIKNGEMPANTRLIAVARRLDAPGQASASKSVDSRGRFAIEGLIPGEYEVALTALTVTPSAPGAPPPPGVVQPRTLAKQNVRVSNETEVEVTLVVDLAAKEKDGDK